MQVQFRVHGVSNGSTAVETEVDGQKMTATVACVEVELVTVSQRHGSLTLRFVGAEREAALARFIPGETLTWQL